MIFFEVRPNLFDLMFFAGLFSVRKYISMLSKSVLVIWPQKRPFLHRECFYKLVLLAEVESRTQGLRPRPRTQKKSETKAKDSLSEDRTSRGQGQECSRPRPKTKDTGASVLKKRIIIRGLQNFFQAISKSFAYPEFLIGGGLNHKSHEITS